MKPIFALALLSLPWIATATRAEEPAMEEGRVTIPYPELRSLLDAVEKAAKPGTEPAPPVEASLGGARYRLDFSGAEPALTADFEVATFTENWHSVPLFGGDARLGSARTNDGASSVIRHDRAYALLAKGKGGHTAQVSIALPPAEDWGKGGGFVLAPAPASVGELRVVGLPAGKSLRIDGVKPARSQEGEMVFPLPEEAAPWRIVLEDATMAAGAEALPSAWTLHSQILLRYADGRLGHTARVQCQADSGSGLSLDLDLPENATGVSVEGEDIADWKLAPRDAGSRPLRIVWETRDVLDRTFLLHWEIPQSPLADSWELAPPRVRHPAPVAEAAPPAESRSLLALVAVDGLELAHPSLQSGVASLRLPEWLREQLGDEDALTAEIAGEAPLSLAATWLPRLATAQATVSLAAFETRLVTDGSTLVTADYTVQHAAPITWKLELPSVDEILACTIDGRDASPVRRGENEIEFRLATPAAVENTSPSTTVRLSYSLKTDPLDPVSGRVALELPLTGLFIHRLDWALSIPEGYEPTAVEGNVRISTGSPGKPSGPHLIHLEKELCHGERPAVEIHYQNRDVSSES
jgi:hypothetical protein